jgi:hypothetical protein
MALQLQAQKQRMATERANVSTRAEFPHCCIPGSYAKMAAMQVQGENAEHHYRN